MRRISSQGTGHLKRLAPRLLFGLAVLLALIFSIWMIREQRFVRVLAFVPVMLAFAAFVVKSIVADFADEVWDDGDALVVKHATTEERIPLLAISRVSHSVWQNPPTITLTLHEPRSFGSTIVFTPEQDYGRVIFIRSKIADDLRRRITERKRANK